MRRPAHPLLAQIYNQAVLGAVSLMADERVENEGFNGFDGLLKD